MRIKSFSKKCLNYVELCLCLPSNFHRLNVSYFMNVEKLNILFIIYIVWGKTSCHMTDSWEEKLRESGREDTNAEETREMREKCERNAREMREKCETGEPLYVRTWSQNSLAEAAGSLGHCKPLPPGFENVAFCTLETLGNRIPMALKFRLLHTIKITQPWLNSRHGTKRH